MSQQKPVPPTKVVEVFRLNQLAYDELEKSLPKIGSTANQIEAGYLLGIQLVLAKLRAGFVVSQ